MSGIIPAVVLFLDDHRDGLNVVESADIVCISWGVRHLWTGPLLIAVAQRLTVSRGGANIHRF